ncbi:hypothetical protein F9817_02225 [Vibrio sp. CAIM 722]|uniref:Phage holin family protein n=1 Tax=Vibrio eleionomae TaxID=2653505 RepID=A0A7X4RT99_9VIBR|nr:hypothetical protein [Vibrio eleionomae]MZI92020.1 hypothetical protein [Vibrio eleionomae]
MSNQRKEREATEQGGPSQKAHQQPKQPITELLGLVARLRDIAAYSQEWGDNTIKLFFLELDMSVIALKRKVIVSVLLLFLMLIFFLSLCILIAVVTFEITSSIILGSVSFVGALAIILIILMFYQHYLNRFVSLKRTREQIKEGIDVFTQKED